MHDGLGSLTSEAPLPWPTQLVNYEVSPEQKRVLVQRLHELKPEIDGVWITNTNIGEAFQFASVLYELLNRADVTFTSDFQAPRTPDQTGVVICVADPLNPSVAARKLAAAFREIGLPTSFDRFSERQSSRPNDAPDLVIFIAPVPL